MTKNQDANLLREELGRAYQAKEYDWAVAFGEQWIRVDPGDTRAYDRLGESLFMTNNLERAQVMADKLKVMNKLGYSGYELAGKIAKQRGDNRTARDELELALQYAPQFACSYLAQDVAEANAALGDIDRAISALEFGLEVTSDPQIRLFLTQKLDLLKDIKSRGARFGLSSLNNPDAQ